jgi:polysaccharide biosynthesis transport protein
VKEELLSTTTSGRSAASAKPRNTPRVQLHPLSIARMFWKGKFILLPLWVALSVVGVIVVHDLPAMYKADALILMAEPKVSDKLVNSTPTTDPQERLNAISHLILSNEQLEKIIEAYDLYPNERKNLSKDEAIQKMRDTDVTLKLESGVSTARPDAVLISYQATDPKIAAAVTNRLADLIIHENDRSRQDRVENADEFFKLQSDQARQTLDRLEARIGSYKNAHSGELPEQQATLSDALSRLHTHLQTTQDALTRADQDKIATERNLQNAQEALAGLQDTAQELRDQAKKGLVIVDRPVAVKPKTRRQTVEEDLRSLRARYGENHPDIKRLVAELASLPPDPVETPGNEPGPQVATTSKAPEAEIPSSLSTAIIGAQERISNLQTQLDQSAKNLNVLNADRIRTIRDIDSYQERLDHVPARAEELEGLTRDYDVATQNYKSLMDKKLAAGMSADLEHNDDRGQFVLVNAAQTPQQPYKPNRDVLRFVAIGLAFVISGLIVLGVQVRSDKILGEWELTPHTVILGRVPTIKTSEKDFKKLTAGASIRSSPVEAA